MLKRLCLAFVFCLLSSVASAEWALYLIDGAFYVPFPAKPEFLGEALPEGQKIRAYGYADEDAVLVYSAMHGGIIVSSHKQQSISKALREFAEGQALVVNGKVSSFTDVQHNGHPSARYIIDYQLQGVSVRKYGILSFVDGRVYQWVVQGFPGHSNPRADTVFDAHYRDLFVGKK